MAQFLTNSQARNFDVNGETFNLIDLIEALERTPDGWISPASVNELQLGQIVHVWALGDRLRRGVVAKLGRTKATVVFTTQRAVDDAARYGQGGATIRVASTPVQLSQIKIPAPAAPVEPTVEAPAAPVEKALDASSELAQSVVAADEEAAYVEAEQHAQTVSGPIDRESILAKPIDSLMDSGVPVDRDITGSAVVGLLEKVWARIRQDHPELPDVVMVTGSGMMGPARWGHFRANGWKARQEAGEDAATNLALGEMFIAGETLAKGSRQVLQTMLHEAAHTLARVRDLKDTSRQGRWHNQTFLRMAEELGLEHKGTMADKTHGFSSVTLTEATVAEYTDLLDDLDREIHLVVDLPWFLTGEEGGQVDDGAQGGEYIGGGRQRKAETTPQSGNLKATCSCPEPNIIRASRKVLDLAVIRCDECEQLFTTSD